MYKLLILLTLSTVSFANCDYTLETFSSDQRVTKHAQAAYELATNMLTQMNFNIVDESFNTIVIDIKPGSYMNRYKVKSFLYRRDDGILINYSYGEGKSYRSQSRSLSKKDILLSVKNSIKQLPLCSDD
jgi:hypothetical protein